LRCPALDSDGCRSKCIENELIGMDTDAIVSVRTLV